MFFTGRKHAGENLARVLVERAKGLAPPIQMCDALSRNVPKLPEKLEILLGNCNAHARRRFVQVTPNFPQECQFVLESFREVYRYDAEAEERGLTPEARLRFHQEHSQPVMDALHAWFEAQFAEKKVEPNSGLGEAITLLLEAVGSADAVPPRSRRAAGFEPRRARPEEMHSAPKKLSIL